MPFALAPHLSPRELFRAQGFPADYIIGDNPAQGLTS